MHGKRITYDDAIKICLKNPYVTPIEGNSDKFKLKSEEEVKVIMAEMEENAKEEENDEPIQD